MLTDVRIGGKRWKWKVCHSHKKSLVVIPIQIPYFRPIYGFSLWPPLSLPNSILDSKSLPVPWKILLRAVFLIPVAFQRFNYIWDPSIRLNPSSYPYEITYSDTSFSFSSLLDLYRFEVPSHIHLRCGLA